jgi:hypothetical protein
VGEGDPLDPVVVDDSEEGREAEVDGHAHLGPEEGEK